MQLYFFVICTVHRGEITIFKGETLLGIYGIVYDELKYFSFCLKDYFAAQEKDVNNNFNILKDIHSITDNNHTLKVLLVTHLVS